MNIRILSDARHIPAKAWLQRLSWLLPLLFLVKGLLWLTLPALYALYAVD